MRWLISCASMLYEGEQTLLNELTLLLANLLVALWRVARCPTAADRLLAANSRLDGCCKTGFRNFRSGWYTGHSQQCDRVMRIIALSKQHQRSALGWY